MRQTPWCYSTVLKSHQNTCLVSVSTQSRKRMEIHKSLIINMSHSLISGELFYFSTLAFMQDIHSRASTNNCFSLYSIQALSSLPFSSDVFRMSKSLDAVKIWIWKQISFAGLKRHNDKIIWVPSLNRFTIFHCKSVEGDTHKFILKPQNKS